MPESLVSSSILSLEEDPRFTQTSWYALQTRSRHEKLVVDLLSKKNFETFLPIRKVKRKWSDRIKQIEEPLFKGYLFVHGSLLRRMEILQTQGVVRFVGFGKIPSTVPEKDLSAIRRFMAEEISIDPFPYLHEGQRVVVRTGPFQGVEGFLVVKKNTYRLVISLDSITQSASIEIDSACVESV